MNTQLVSGSKLALALAISAVLGACDEWQWLDHAQHGWRHDDRDQQHAGCNDARRDRTIGTGHHADCNDARHELACCDCTGCDSADSGQQYPGGSPGQPGHV